MATNFIQPGECLTLTAPTGGVTAGTPVLIGALLVVPTTTVAQTLPFEGCTMGVFTLPKATGATWSEGQLLYWDDTAKKCTPTATSNTRIGCAVAAAASGDTTGKVRLNGAAAGAGTA
jgi:predicted RecA/RadA family phage recombinase